MAFQDSRNARRHEAESFVGALADPARMAIAAHEVGIVVAHPDDETIGCGAQLRRLEGATVIIVTDGAPRNPADAREHGFASTDAYSARRLRELRNALTFAGTLEDNLILLGLSDQTAAYHLADLTRAMFCLFTARNLRTVMTHAYEGGHPDHDATAFAAHAAARIARSRGQPITVLEMPFYRAADGNWLRQSITASSGVRATDIRLNKEEQSLKRSMLGAYRTQRETLAAFDTATEHFRPAPDYDFTVLPNDGKLLYERYDWGMDRARWLTLAQVALAELGLEPPCG